ncbi:MAG: hypothetical protein ABI652_00940 [Acidobacteriota bacterium]
MALTKWNDPSGPGAGYRTSDIVLASCAVVRGVGPQGIELVQMGHPDFVYARPPLSYSLNTEATTVEATAQADVTSDDRFQRMGRVHLSHPGCTMPQPAEYGANCGPGKLVFINDLASVWTITLLSATPEGGIVIPDLQIRIIQSIRGVQMKRATVKYKGPFVSGYVAQLYGVESTDLEIWSWIDPADASLGAKVQLIFGVSVKMRLSSRDFVTLGDNVVPIP